MVFPDMKTTGLTLLSVKEFNKVKLGSGVRLFKCETCGRLTDSGMIIDRDIVEEGTSGEPEKNGYETWILCPECSQGVAFKVTKFADELFEDIEKLAETRK